MRDATRLNGDACPVWPQGRAITDAARSNGLLPSAAVRVGHVAILARYPVKSMGGELLDRAEFARRGVAGDRSWAAYAEDGRIGSGKTTRRFRRVEGLLNLRARLDGDVPVIEFPDGQEERADAPSAAVVLSAVLGRRLQLRPESEVSHHDESPVHVVTTAALRQVGRLLGQPVAAARFRANVVLEVDGDAFVEDGWRGRELALGSDVVLRLGAGMSRCVMVDMPQRNLPASARLLKTLGQVHQMEFGLKADVIRAGTVFPGDDAILT